VRKTFTVLAVLLLLVIGTSMQTSSMLEMSGPTTSNLEFSFSSQAGLFTALVNNETDVMCTPLTKSQYDTAIENPELQLAPVYGNDISEIGINNNRTIPTYPNWRSPTNYTEFRKAMELSVDKDSLIAGPSLQGFATRIDTPAPMPNMGLWVYPYQTLFDPYAAAVLLNNTGFMPGNTSNPYYDSTKNWSSPTIRTYPLDHEKAGQDLDAIIGYARADIPPRLEAAQQLTSVLRALGIPVDLRTSWPPFGFPIQDGDFHFYTAGWVLTGNRVPMNLQMYISEYAYPWGPNYIYFQDLEYDYWAERFLNATSITSAHEAALECQRILLEKVASVWLWSSKSYEAYRGGWLNMINMRLGYSFNNQWGYLFTYYQDYPVPHALRVGLLQITGLNPILDPPNEVMESVFSHLMYLNPYKPHVIGQSPAGGDLPWLAKDWRYWVDDANRAHVEFALEKDIVWHDGAQFTAYDVNYTIWLIKSYPDSWYYPYVEHVAETVIHNDYDIEIIFDIPSIWTLYNIGLYIFILPKHLPPVDIRVGTGAWKYSPIQPVDKILLTANTDFWLTPLYGEIDFVYYWNLSQFPRNGSYRIGLSDLVMFAKSYGSQGNPPTPGWEPGCDFATPSCIIGLSDLVTLARNYGKTWGEYDP